MNCKKFSRCFSGSSPYLRMLGWAILLSAGSLLESAAASDDMSKIPLSRHPGVEVSSENLYASNSLKSAFFSNGFYENVQINFRFLLNLYSGISTANLYPRINTTDLTSANFFPLNTFAINRLSEDQFVASDTNTSNTENRSCERPNPPQEVPIENSSSLNQGVILDYRINGMSEPQHNAFERDAEFDHQFKQDVDAIVAPYLGKDVSSTDLKAIKDKITLLYLRDGYVTSRAESLTIQSDGTLIIEVIEGFICEVRVRNQDTSLSRVADRMPLGRRLLSYLGSDWHKRPVNLSQIERRIRALSEDEWIEPDQTVSRLLTPEGSFSARYNRLFPPGESAPLSRLQEALLARDSGDDIDPGASILEIEVEVNKRVENSPDDDPQESRPDIRLSSRIPALDNRRFNEFEDHFGTEFTRQMVDPVSMRFALHSLERQNPAIRAAVVYIASDGARVFIRAETARGRTIEIESITQFEPEAPENELSFEAGQVVQERDDEESDDDDDDESGEEVNRDELVKEVENLWSEIQKPNSSNTYLPYSDKLYDLLIRPIEEKLEEQELEVNTLLFVMEKGLRLLPVAALYDSEANQFLAEKYKISIIPSFRALDLRPSDLNQADILAMGISEFSNSDTYSPLNAVPLELGLIESIWRSNVTRPKILRNDHATLANLRRERREHPYQIVHLATHANFRRGEPGDSTIQLWDTPLPLNALQVATLNWNNPPVDLLVLSACQTALGDEQAELGFAGLSLQSEVKSVLASLWRVSDLASLIYMMEFYRNLSSGVTKAEAVQNAQMAMLDEQRLKQNLRELKIVISSLLASNHRLESLTEAEEQGLHRILEQLNGNGIRNDDAIEDLAERLTHPFYWSSYTLVGSPW